MELLLLGAAIFAAGLLFGYRMGRGQPAPAAPSPSEAEARALQEERVAFQLLKSLRSVEAWYRYRIHR